MFSPFQSILRGSAISFHPIKRDSETPEPQQSEFILRNALVEACCWGEIFSEGGNAWKYLPEMAGVFQLDGSKLIHERLDRFKSWNPFSGPDLRALNG